jgi:PST family polysaccharide transporter
MKLDKLKALREKLSPNLQKVLANTAWLFADKILQLALGLFVGLWVARYLKPELFGLLNYAIATGGLFAPLASLGLNSIILRDLAREPANKDEILGTTFLLKFFASILTIILTMITVWILEPKEHNLHLMVGIVVLATLFQQISEPIDYWFGAQVQSKYSVWSMNSAYLLINGVKLFLIQLKASLIAFAWAIPAEKALAMIVLVITYQMRGNSVLTWRFNRERAQELLKQSWSLILSGFVIFIYMRIDQIMIGQINTNPAELGNYAAAVKVSELWYFVPNAVIQSVFPSIVQAKDKSEELYKKRIQNLLYLMCAISYAVAIPVALFSQPIIRLLYGKNYLGAAPSLAVLIWAGLFVTIGMARSPWLITENLMNFSAATTGVGAVVNIILNFLLIPKYGGLGAGIATLIAQFFASYASNAIFPKTRPMFVMQTKAIFFWDWILMGWKKLSPS